MEVLEAVLRLFAGLGVFMFGLQVMSQNLESSAGKSMQKLFARISNNRFMGVGVGASATAIIQSSSATTVMVIGFVNAGQMTLAQATGIIMGANIGTTMTAIIVAFQSLPIAPFFMFLSAVGVFMAMFVKSDNIKRIGGILCGIGLVFVGLDFMSGSLKISELHNFFAEVFKVVNNPFLLILVGLAATAILQSSSAITSLVITLAFASSGDNVALPVISGLYIVLGSNIGTCATGLLASIGANKNAKRTALIHLMFNLFGVIVATPILLLFHEPIINFLVLLSGGKPTLQIAFFHLIFNTVTMLLLIGFVKQIVFISEKLISDKSGIVGTDRLYYLDDRILQSPPIAVAQMLKEVANMAEIASKNFDLSIENLLDASVEHSAEIAKKERELNFLNKAIVNYLIKISSLNIGAANEKIIGSLYHVVSDIERIGDHAENFDEIARQMNSDDMNFSEDAKAELKDMAGKTQELFKKALSIFETRKTAQLSEVNALEEAIDKMVKTLANNHIERLNKGLCTVENGVHFYSCTTNLERVADHLTNIAYSVVTRPVSQSRTTEKVMTKKPKPAVKASNKK